MRCPQAVSDMEASNDPRLRLKDWIARGEAKLLPLSLTQREIWENSPVPPGDPSNHICATIEIRGRLNFDLCEEALSKVVRRQEALRTSFLSGRERIARLVLEQADATMLRRDVVPGRALHAAMGAIFAQPFDMVRGPLFRVGMLRVSADHHVLAMAFHHAIADGWTLGVFVSDFAAAYLMALREAGRSFGRIRGVREALPPPQLTYSGWAALEAALWQPSQVAREAAYWKRRLEGARLLFGAQVGATQPLRRLITHLPPALSASARELAKRSGTTLFAVLITTFQVALFHWRGARDVVFGVPHANRKDARVRDVMGSFAGVLPLRLQLDAERTFAETLCANHALQLDDFAHAMPFAELAAALPRPSPHTLHPVFDIRFALQNHPIPDIVLPGISTRLRTLSTGTSRFDIACELTEIRAGFEVVWLYRRPLVHDTDVKHLDRLLKTVLKRAGEHPGDTPETMHPEQPRS
jgi:hypothetical protein